MPKNAHSCAGMSKPTSCSATESTHRHQLGAENSDAMRRRHATAATTMSTDKQKTFRVTQNHMTLLSAEQNTDTSRPKKNCDKLNKFAEKLFAAALQTYLWQVEQRHERDCSHRRKSANT